MQRILFVCLGNICRSPAAEAVIRAKAPHLFLDSAGTANYHVGNPPYGAMQHAAQSRGYAMADLRARQFSAHDFNDFDVIIAMDSQNADDIEALRPERSYTPVVLFTDHIGQYGMAVPDPYYTRDLEGCLDLIERCADALIAGVDRGS